jgi:tripartite-type tricarboxylate transporter receptor subunit TctC
MKLTRRDFLHLTGTAAAILPLPAVVSAQAHPARPVRVIVPYAAGGPNDTVARIVAQKLSERWGRSFFIENIPAGAGNVGTELAAKAAPDGYTIVVVTSSFFINPGLYERIRYDPVKDFSPLTMIASAPHVLTVHPSFPARNVAEFVAKVISNPGKYSYASAGVGQSSHLAGELFKLSFGLDLVHVPFNGAAPAMTSAIGGHVPICFISLPAAAANIKEGNLRALAVTSSGRALAFPDISTMAEAGFANQESVFMQGILFPAGTPRGIVDQWYSEISRIAATPEIRQRLITLGLEPVVNTPQEFGAQIAREAARWTRVIREARIKVTE